MLLWAILLILFILSVGCRMLELYIVDKSRRRVEANALPPEGIVNDQHDLLLEEFEQLEREVAQRERRAKQEAIMLSCSHPKWLHDVITDIDSSGNPRQIIYCTRCRKHIFHIIKGQVVIKYG